MLTSICYSFLVIQSALVKYWHQAKNVSLTWMGQTVLGTEWTRGSFRLFLMSVDNFWKHCLSYSADFIKGENDFIFYCHLCTK